MIRQPILASPQTGRVQKVLSGVDAISSFAGRLVSWLILALTVMICLEIASRSLLGAAHTWVFDMSYMLYGAVLLMAGAYALAKDAHVRGDILYGALPPRGQASIDLVLYPVLFIPGVIALTLAGYDYAEAAWTSGETSALSPGGPPVWPLRMAIPIAGALLLLQGATEMLRAVICLRTGAWPARSPDVAAGVSRLQTDENTNTECDRQGGSA